MERDRDGLLVGDECEDCGQRDCTCGDGSDDPQPENDDMFAVELESGPTEYEREDFHSDGFEGFLPDEPDWYDD